MDKVDLSVKIAFELVTMLKIEYYRFNNPKAIYARVKNDYSDFQLEYEKDDEDVGTMRIVEYLSGSSKILEEGMLSLDPNRIDGFKKAIKSWIWRVLTGHV